MMKPIAVKLPLESSVADRWSAGSNGWKRHLRCPRCASSLRNPGLHPSCSDTTCEYSATGFPLFDAQPVLIDFANSIFDREMYCSGHGSALRRDVTGRSLGSRVHQFVLGENAVAASNCARFIELLKQGARRPIVLVIGGGTVGLGANELYCTDSIELVGTDVYASPYTALVTDAHKLPLKTGCSTAFGSRPCSNTCWSLQPSLTRFTGCFGAAGWFTPKHRSCSRCTSGPMISRALRRAAIAGCSRDFRNKRRTDRRRGVALVWSIRYFCRALGAGDKLSLLIALPFFWIRFLDRFARGRATADAASGFFFLGRRSDRVIDPHSMTNYYDRQK